MARWLRQSTAVDIPIGPFLDSTDGVTAETALTIAQADVRLKKNNGAWAQVNDNTSAAHEENGWYEKELDATDTNTLGMLMIAVHEAGALPVWHEFLVVPANVWDSFFAADLLQVDSTQLLGTAYATPTVGGVQEVDITHIAGAANSATTAQLGVNVVQISADATAADNAELMFDGTGYAGGTIKLGIDVVQVSGDATAADTLESHMDGTTPLATAADLATVDTVVDAIKAKTDNLPTDPADQSLIIAATDAIAAFIDTEVAAIKTKTDLIPGTQDGKTFAEVTLLMASVLLGKVSGMDTSAPAFRSLDDTIDRITATTDTDGNRTAVTLDASSP